MKALFYLPVVTPWWFDAIIEPLIRCMAKEAEVAVLAPTPWTNTGIGPREMQRMADLPGVQWYIMEGPDHRSVRTIPANPAELIDFVTALAPDFTFCRSADRDTAAQFPGTVRFIMEADAPPFTVPTHRIALRDDLFDHGVLPPLTPDQEQWLDRAIAPQWEALEEKYAALRSSRAAVLEESGIDPDKPLLLLPLEYEHRENFFLMHRVGPRPNHKLVAEIAARVTPHCTLAITDHPLNRLYVNCDALHATVAELDDVMLFENPIAGLPATVALTPHSDAILLGDSKSFSLAAFFGTPILRRSRFPSGDWLHVTEDLDSLMERMGSGKLPCPDPALTRRWFSFHFANDAFDPLDPSLTASALVARMEQRVDPARWEAGLAHLNAPQPEHA